MAGTAWRISERPVLQRRVCKGRLHCFGFDESRNQPRCGRTGRHPSDEPWERLHHQATAPGGRETSLLLPHGYGVCHREVREGDIRGPYHVADGQRMAALRQGGRFLVLQEKRREALGLAVRCTRPGGQNRNPALHLAHVGRPARSPRLVKRRLHGQYQGAPSMSR